MSKAALEVEKAQQTLPSSLELSNALERATGLGTESSVVSPKSPVPSTSDIPSIGSEKTSNTATEAEAVSTAAKRQLLGNLTQLRDQRSDLIDRFNVVVAELRKKGGDIVAFEKYRDAAVADLVDAKDTSAVWSFLSGWAKSESGGLKWTRNTLFFVSILLVSYALSIAVGWIAERLAVRTRTLSNLQRALLKTGLQRITVLIGLLLGLSVIGVPVGPLVAVLSALGVVLGFALQESLASFFSGILILIYRPFDIGDLVETGGINGKVAAMNLMSTHFRTLDNKLMIVPNSAVFGERITVTTEGTRRRLDILLSIKKPGSVDETRNRIELILSSHGKILTDPAPVVRLQNLSESDATFICLPWTNSEDYSDVFWDITCKAKEIFGEDISSKPVSEQEMSIT